MAIEVGNIFEGRVTGVKPFGAFVALPEGRVGMVHISEVSNEYVQDIAAVLHDGDTVKVQVINVAPDGKIALSIKRLLPPAPRAPREGRGPRPNNNGPREGGFRRNGQGGRPQGGRGPARDAAPRVWQPKAPAKSDNLSFEDMMSRFKSQSLYAYDKGRIDQRKIFQESGNFRTHLLYRRKYRFFHSIFHHRFHPSFSARSFIFQPAPR